MDKDHTFSLSEQKPKTSTRADVCAILGAHVRLLLGEVGAWMEVCMSKPHRCRECKHRPGLRSTSNMAKADKKPYDHGEQAKKAGCGCECHR